MVLIIALGPRLMVSLSKRVRVLGMLGPVFLCYAGGILVSLILPETAGFTASLDSVSGSINCDFPGTLGDDRVTVGDGSLNIRCNTVSGNLVIHKN